MALQEWLTTDYQKGPITALTIVDLTTRKYARISKSEEGFMIPMKFENELIVFEEELLATGRSVEHEINYEQIQNWEEE